jgi:hypothetical protein
MLKNIFFQPCEMCLEGFHEFWHEEEEAWYVRVEGRLFHPVCLEDKKGLQ